MEDHLRKIKYDTTESVVKKISLLRKQKLIPINDRIQQLKILRAAFIKYEAEIHLANKEDLGQEHFNSFFNTFTMVKNELNQCIEKIHEWTAPQSVDTPVLFAPSKSYVVPEPFGVCLIFSAWNSQFLTLIMPIAQAISAGNVIIAKPSEMAESSAYICQKILQELDPEICQIIQGGAEVCIELLKHKHDIIIFTGSPQKGVLVAKAAAEFLTPCILELGGQNPVIVDDTADIESTAYNLISGRCVISGQACIAPEYVFVNKNIYEELSKALKETSRKFFGENAKESKDYSRIINEFHTERLANLLKCHNGKAVCGGNFDLKEKYIEPTVVAYDSIESLSKSELAKGEIFGPILYMAPYEKLDDCLNYINSKEKPLVLYYFGTDKKTKEKIKAYTSSGAFVVNDCVIHFANLDLPFGGVGTSGYSAYHGKYGFMNLSHLKPVMERPQRLMKMRYPPFTDGKQKLMKFLLSNVTFTQGKFLKVLLLSVVLLSAFLMRNTIKNKIF